MHLHCFERNNFPIRPTTDIDTVLDIRTYPEMLLTFTKVLKDLGFISPLTNQGQHQHRWIKDEAIIDLLIPSNLGARSSNRKGVTGSTTISTIGGQGAINRSEKVVIKLGSRTGVINRPHLMGSVIIKCAAFNNYQDEARNRHLMDMLTLLTMIELEDEKDLILSKNEKKRIKISISQLEKDSRIINSVQKGRESIDRFKLLLQSL